MSGPAPASPIDQVINQLEDVVMWCLIGPSAPDRLGYFASLYLRVTNTIKSKLGAGYFDDDARMANLDAIFAGRFLTASNQFKNGDPALPQAWSMAFQATNRTDLIIIQQLLLGINVHINLDLGFASVTACPGAQLPPLHDDFMKITSLLAGLVPTVASEIGALSPLISMLNFLDENGEIAVLNFSISAARNAAWTWANQLATMTNDQQQTDIVRMNGVVAGLGSRIIAPGLILQAGVDLVRSTWRE